MERISGYKFVRAVSFTRHGTRLPNEGITYGMQDRLRDFIDFIVDTHDSSNQHARKYIMRFKGS